MAPKPIILTAVNPLRIRMLYGEEFIPGYLVPPLIRSFFYHFSPFFLVSLFSPSLFSVTFSFPFLYYFPFSISCFSLFPYFSLPFVSTSFVVPSVSPSLCLHYLFIFVSFFLLLSLSFVFYSAVLTLWWDIIHSCSCFRPQLRCIQEIERWHSQKQTNPIHMRLKCFYSICLTWLSTRGTCVADDMCRSKSRALLTVVTWDTYVACFDSLWYFTTHFHVYSLYTVSSCDHWW